jgi:hypothetical protein
LHQASVATGSEEAARAALGIAIMARLLAAHSRERNPELNA